MHIHYRKTSKDLKSIRICLHEGKNSGLNQSTFCLLYTYVCITIQGIFKHKYQRKEENASSFSEFISNNYTNIQVHTNDKNNDEDELTN